MKGQITLTNLIMLVLTIFVYLILATIMQEQIENTATALLVSPNEYTHLTIIVLRLLPMLLAVAIVMTAFHYAVPRPPNMR